MCLGFDKILDMTVKEYVELHKNKPVINPNDSTREWFIIGCKEILSNNIVGERGARIILGSFDKNAMGWPIRICEDKIHFVFPDPIFIKFFWNIPIVEIRFK